MTRLPILCALAALVSGTASPAFAETAAQLSVTSTPSLAPVSVDGEHVGLTPVTALPLSPGRHRLEVDLPSQAPLVRDSDLTEGQTLAVDAPGAGVAGASEPAPVAAPLPPASRSANATGVPASAPLAAVQVAAPSGPERHRPWLDVPWGTWLAAAVAFPAFGVGLGFGVAANDIDHRAGVSLAPSGVDLGVTRSTALAGQQDANIANALLIGAGVAAVTGLAFAAFFPEAPAPAPSTSPTPAASTTAAPK